MESALDYVATKLLTNAIETHFPSVNPDLDPESRFYVHQKDFGSSKYIIEDLDFKLQTRISKRWPEEPTFNLVHWYLQYLGFEHQYSERYDAKQRELYGIWSDNSEIGSMNLSPAEEEQRRNTGVPVVTECLCPEHPNHILQSCSSREDAKKIQSKWPQPKDDLVKRNLVHSDQWMCGYIGNAFTERLTEVLTDCQPYPGDEQLDKPMLYTSCFYIPPQEDEIFTIHDNKQGFSSHLHLSWVRLSSFSVGKWYAEQCARQLQDPYQWETAHNWLMSNLKRDHHLGEVPEKRATHLLEIGAP